MDDMSLARKTFASAGLRGYPFAVIFLYAERDEMIWQLIRSTLIFAGVSVVGVVAIFIRPVGTFLIALCIFTIDCSLFAIMALWDIPVGAFSFICLAMAAGMSVDYVVHVAHAALNPIGATLDETSIAEARLTFALDHTGLITI